MKKHLALLAIALFTFLCQPLRSQPFPPFDFVAPFGTPESHEIARKIIPTEDGHYLITGTQNNSGFVMKMASCGDSLWFKTFLFGTETGLSDIGELSTGEIVVTGYCKACAANDNTEKILLLKLSATGESIQMITDGFEGYNARGIALEVTPNDEITLAGNTSTNTLAGVRVKLVNYEGNTLAVNWQSYYDQLFLDYVGDLAATDDGDYLVTGWSSQFAGPEYVTAYRISATGSLLWGKRWQFDTPVVGTQRGMVIQKSSNQNVTVAGVVELDDI